MNKPPPTLNPHRFARPVAWLQAMLAWAASVLFADTPPRSRRHIRQRYGFLSLDRIERLVRALAIARAMQLTRLRKRARPPLRNAAGPGFRRRVARGALMRAIAGARFRKALKHRDSARRLKRLMVALANIDAIVRRYLVRRARRRLTRLHAVVIRAPGAEALVSRALPSPCAPDTS